MIRPSTIISYFLPFRDHLIEKFGGEIHLYITKKKAQKNEARLILK